MANQTTQFTMRGLDPRIAAEIRRVAKANGIFLNKAALSILNRGVGIENPPQATRRIGKARRPAARLTA